MAKIFAYAAAGMAFLLMQAGGGFAQQAGSRAEAKAAPLKIDSGDLVDVLVYDNPDLSGHFRVDEKGDIVFPLLGPVHVGGETAEEAGETIAKQYVAADILKEANAHATVFIAEFATQRILVNGEVRSPGAFPALGVRTLDEMVTAAGGETPQASSMLVITRKTDPENRITVEYDPGAASPVVPQVQIFPGDTITVPNAGGVYILGSVTRPGFYMLEQKRTLTVEKALALSGGSVQGANMKHAHIVRTLKDGKKEDIVFNANEILKGRAADIALKNGDIFYVPISNVKVAILRAINSAIGVGTSIATFRLAYQ